MFLGIETKSAFQQLTGTIICRFPMRVVDYWYNRSSPCISNRTQKRVKLRESNILNRHSITTIIKTVFTHRLEYWPRCWSLPVVSVWLCELSFSHSPQKAENSDLIYCCFLGLTHFLVESTFSLWWMHIKKPTCCGTAYKQKSFVKWLYCLRYTFFFTFIRKVIENYCHTHICVVSIKLHPAIS